MVNRRDTSLRVLALGFDARSHTALQLLFRTKCEDRVALVGDDDADVGLIDLDSLNAVKMLADQRARHPDRALILLALEPPKESLPNTIHIKKPVQVQSLLAVLDELGARLSATVSPVAPNTGQPMPEQVSKADSSPAKPSMKVFLAPEENKSANQAAMLLDERGFGEYIGSLRDIDPTNPAEVKFAQYDPARYLQGYLQSAFKTAAIKNCALRLNTGWKPITVFPQTREVWVDADDQQLRSFCLVPVHSISDLGFTDSDAAVMTVSPASAIKIKEDEYDSSKMQRMDTLIWKIALWTSAGRVPEDIDLNRPVYLLHWPNMTRLLMFPNAMRIAALLMDQPRSLLDVAETLNIRQQYVFAFFSAARALGLAGQAARRSDILIAPPSLESRKNTGLLKKILQRLLRR